MRPPPRVRLLKPGANVPHAVNGVNAASAVKAVVSAVKAAVNVASAAVTPPVKTDCRLAQPRKQ